MGADRYSNCPSCNGNLREDYEFNLAELSLHVSYSCKCTDCGFSYENKECWDIYA